MAKQQPEIIEPPEFEAAKKRTSVRVLVGYLDVEHEGSDQVLTLRKCDE